MRIYGALLELYIGRWIISKIKSFNDWEKNSFKVEWFLMLRGRY